jgi:molybdopterin molybdotransferase
LKGFQELTPVDEALQTFLAAFGSKPLKTVRISLGSALNRVLAEKIVAEVNLPRFDRSAVDGYAVKAEETFGATQSKPKIMRLTNRDVIGHNETKQVWTGNRVPKNADAVVMLENILQDKNQVQVWNPVTPGENVSKMGEDVSEGEVVVKVGTRLGPHHLGLIGALGASEVEVFEKPKIAILATGNELVEIGHQLHEGQIYDVNRLVLSGLCLDLGADTLDLGIARDDVGEISEKLRLGLENADALITSGGTSVGGSDVVPEAVDNIGKPGVIVHGMAMRPAMPTALAMIDGTPVLVLSGNPVAAMIGFEVFARPMISKMLGMKRLETRFEVQAKVTRRIATALGRKSYVRVRVSWRGGELRAEPISARGSSVISTMTKANGYIVVPENREGLEEGELVTVRMFDHIGGR